MERSADRPDPDETPAAPDAPVPDEAGTEDQGVAAGEPAPLDPDDTEH